MGMTLRAPPSSGGLYRTIDAQSNGISSANSASENATALQDLMDDNTEDGATIWFSEPIACNPITVRSNIHLRGNNVASFKGSRPAGGGAVSSSAQPSGAAFLITSTSAPFCLMENNTSIEGFVFYYPSQNYAATTIAGTTSYPVTIKFSPSGTVPTTRGLCVSLRRLCFVGASACIEALGTAIATDSCISDVELDLLYGYPLGGSFIKLAYVADIPRITRCHVNPTAGYLFLPWASGSTFGCPVTDALILDCCLNGAAAFSLNHCDDFMMSQCFNFGTQIGFNFLGCYGSMVDCGADTVMIGAYVTGVEAYKAITITNFFPIPHANVSSSGNRHAIVFAGPASMLKVQGCHGITNLATAAFITVSGSGVQRLMVTDTSATGVGSWSTGINQVNGSAVVTGTVAVY